MKHVISRISDGKKASEIVQGVDLLQCMKWLNQAFEQIIKETIKHCFKKRGFSEVPLLAEEPNEELGDLLKSLTIEVVPDEYSSFGYDIDISEIPIKVQKKEWEDILRKQFIKKLMQILMKLTLAVMTATWKTTIILKLWKRKIFRYHFLLHCRC